MACCTFVRCALLNPDRARERHCGSNVKHPHPQYSSAPLAHIAALLTLDASCLAHATLHLDEALEYREGSIVLDVIVHLTPCAAELPTCQVLELKMLLKRTRCCRFLLAPGCAQPPCSALRGQQSKP